VGELTADNIHAELVEVFENRVEVVGGVDKEGFEGAAGSWWAWDGEAVDLGWGGDGTIVEVVVVGLCVGGFIDGDGFDAVAVLVEVLEGVVGEVEEVVEFFGADLGVVDVDADGEPEGAGDDADCVVARVFGVDGDLVTSACQFAGGGEADDAGAEDGDGGVIGNKVCCGDGGAEGEGDAGAAVAIVVDHGFGADGF